MKESDKKKLENTKKYSNQVYLKTFMDFFRGNTLAYGCHVYKFPEDSGQKEKGESYTKIEPITQTLYETHLAGGEGLGIIPINEDNYCYFAVIDIDDYDKEKLKPIFEIIKKYLLPFFTFRSKSGGLHLYCFFEHKVTAASVRETLTKYLDVFSLPANTEIFPKQEKLKSGAAGNWINLPYWNAEKTSQYLYTDKPLLFSEAMDTIKKTELKTLKDLLENLYFDAPPCVQRGIISGEVVNRNIFLFNVCVYFKQKFPAEYREKLLEINNSFPEPLPISEIEKTIFSSQDKKEYKYKCVGVENLCNKEECNKRIFGTQSLLLMENLTQFKGAEPYYQLNVNGKILTFYNEKDLRDQNKFCDLCMRELYFLPPLFKRVKWYAKLNELFKNINIVEIKPEEDVSSVSILFMRLKEFISLGHAKTKKQIELGRVYKDIVNHEFVFTLDSFLKFLSAKSFKKPLSEINKELRAITESRRVGIHNDGKGGTISAIAVSFETVGYSFDYNEVMDFSKLVPEEDNTVLEEDNESEDF
jgi:hypothetical protein